MMLRTTGRRLARTLRDEPLRITGVATAALGFLVAFDVIPEPDQTQTVALSALGVAVLELLRRLVTPNAKIDELEPIESDHAQPLP